VGGAVKREASVAFEAEAGGEDDERVSSGEVDWISLAPPRRRVCCLEDATSKGERLRREGATLAEAERHWEAIQKWDEALLFTPADHRLHEMKAQVYMSLCEVYPAVVSARRAVALNPNWWIAHQTLGRANLGIGEVKLALGCFSRALHLNPADEELLKDDLLWSLELLDKKRVSDELAANQIQECRVKITEINDSNDAIGCSASDEMRVLDSAPLARVLEAPPSVMKTLPANYVCMRF